MKNKIKFLLILALWLPGFYIFSAVPSYQKILIMNAADDDSEKDLFNNMKVVFSLTKLNYEVVDAYSHKAGRKVAALTPDDLLIINAQARADILCKEEIVRFVHGGGSLFIPLPGDDDESFQSIGGFKYLGKDVLCSGFVVNDDIFPGFGFIAEAFKDRKSQSRQVTLDKDVKVIASFDDGQGAVWIKRFGAGKVMISNCVFFEDPVSRGIFLQFLSLLNDYFISSQLNAKVFQIDDFPFPVPEGTEYIISGEYDGRSYEEFYQEIWWPQMKEIAHKYDLHYTCLVVSDYENLTTMPPKPISRRQLRMIKYYFQELDKEGFEIGIHGYNHVPLVIDFPEDMKRLEYNLWRSADDMASTLVCLKQTLHRITGKRIYTTYVAPSNMLTAPGKMVIKQVFTDIDCFSGISENLSGGEKSNLVQEIGPDPDCPGVWDLPRCSDGYIYKPMKMWLIFNELAWSGLFCHFVHPDDVLDDERSENMLWKRLHDNLIKILDSIVSRFPNLRGLTARALVAELKKRHETKVFCSRQGKVITVNFRNMKTTMYHYLRLNDNSRVKAVKNGSYEPIGNIKGLYLIKALRSPLKIMLE